MRCTNLTVIEEAATFAQDCQRTSDLDTSYPYRDSLCLVVNTLKDCGTV